MEEENPVAELLGKEVLAKFYSVVEKTEALKIFKLTNGVITYLEDKPYDPNLPYIAKALNALLLFEYTRNYYEGNFNEGLMTQLSFFKTACAGLGYSLEALKAIKATCMRKRQDSHRRLKQKSVLLVSLFPQLHPNCHLKATIWDNITDDKICQALQGAEFQRLDCPPPSVQYQNLERPVLPSLNQEERKRLFEATDDPANKRQRPDEEDGVEQVEQQQIAQNILPSPSIAQPSIAPTGETSAVWPSFVQLPVIEGLTGSRIQFPIIEGIGENIQLPTIEPMVENKIQTPNVEPVGENSEGENSEGIPSIVPILEVPSVSK